MILPAQELRPSGTDELSEAEGEGEMLAHVQSLLLSSILGHQNGFLSLLEGPPNSGGAW